MTGADTRTDELERLEAKVDLLTEQMSMLTAEADIRRRQREMFQDLTADLSRVGEGAMELATREFESLGETADVGDVVRLIRRLVEVAPTLERAAATLDQAASFIDDVAPLGTDALALLTDRLADAEERGYFAFAGAGAGVIDRIVTDFGEDDLVQLGDNVVTILETVKEITQPEMLDLLGHMIDAVRQQQRRVIVETDEVPSLWSLARQARDPDVRRGMARALGTLRAVSVETGPEGTTKSTPQPPTESHAQGEE
ncbi:MAG: DUF1641 domain-containing protein [Actinomycetia bacterium]|nr:DUF1641 domain-containing protein [Actinomycetes bacterium]MCP4085778.1 DUF1641 domain-containing protein [Actinomycetes bacterium]